MRHALLFLSAFLISIPALAQESVTCPQCSADSEQIAACVQKEWGEDVQVMALNERGSMIRIFVNQRTGAWTFITSMPSGQGCINATGTNFEIMLLPEGSGT